MKTHKKLFEMTKTKQYFHQGELVKLLVYKLITMYAIILLNFINE